MVRKCVRYCVAIIVVLLMCSVPVWADTYLGQEVGNSISAEDVTGEEIANRSLEIINYARTHGFKYGNSTAVEPCTDGIISCDRLAAATLWSLGFRDQSRGGFVVGNHESYLVSHGFEQSYGIGELKTGSIVKVVDSVSSTCCDKWFSL